MQPVRSDGGATTCPDGPLEVAQTTNERHGWRFDACVMRMYVYPYTYTAYGTDTQSSRDAGVCERLVIYITQCPHPISSSKRIYLCLHDRASSGVLTVQSSPGEARYFEMLGHTSQPNGSSINYSR
jgi:hypothetical protein